MRKLYTFIICLGFMQMAIGQVTTNYNAKWFFGVNTGLTWQSTDVSNKTNGGWGLTLGKSFNYNSGSLLSFDVRGRFLRGYWYGQDQNTSSFVEENAALSSGSTNYKDTLGYAVHNFQTENYLLNLELVAHANRLRERTRWDAYIFGGIGLNWSQTYGDYLNRDAVTGDLSLYNWDPANLSKSNLKSIQDGVYETALDGSSQNSYNFFTSKSLGFGLGYQVARAITIGVEHKTTFTNVDHFDGFNSKGKNENDIYHYTNAFIRFRLFGGKHTEEVQVIEEENLPPVVQFTQPNYSGSQVNTANYTIQANIKNVFDQDNVVFVQNGTTITNYSYNTRTDVFTANVTLVEGQNNFVLTGNNQYGTDTKATMIIYKIDVVEAPIVRFIDPAMNPTTVTTSGYNITGNILNVDTKNQVKVLVNGTDRSDFNFNTNNGNALISISLVPGSNTIQITGTNSAGTDSEVTTIIYKVDEVINPPVVYFTDPTSSTKTVGVNTYTIRGKVLNVDNNSGVKFMQNGSVKSNFTFNPSTDDFSYNANLGVGQNTFVLSGTNTDGTVTATTVIVYDRATPKPPVVTISNPNGSSASVNVPQFSFAGYVQNVTTQSQVQLTVNGSTISNFSFNAGTIGANLTLNQGTNVIKLTGTNPDGTDSEQVSVVYTPVPTEQAPVVYFTTPGTSPTTVTGNTFTIRGKVLNVASSSNVTFKKNGSNQSSFSYNTSSDEFVSTVSLNQGQNVFELIGTNSAGTNSASTIIVYSIPTPQPPVVNITNPNGSLANTNVAQYAFVGYVQNVTSQSQVQLTLNGYNISNFNFNSGTGMITSTLSLNSGSNTVKLSGSNNDGTASDQATIVYTRIVTPQPPLVDITNPNGSSANTNVAQYPFVGYVQNVTTQNQVQLTLNGGTISNFNFNSGTGMITSNLALNSGSNIVKLSGSNNDGTASDQATIIYTPVVTVNPPVVTYIDPNVNPKSITTGSFTVRATVANVSSPSGVNVKHNGSNVSAFTFGSNSLIFTLNMNDGANVITVTGTNSGGIDTKSTTIVYTKPVVAIKPVVKFTNPTRSGQTVTVPQYTIKATVTGVDSESQITLKQNNNVIPAAQFTYVKATSQLSFVTTLDEGPNSFYLAATNSSGMDNELTTVSYNAPCVDPVISPVSPSRNTYTVDDESIKIVWNVKGITSSDQVAIKQGRMNYKGSYDAAKQQVSATIPLFIGNNIIILTATNNCAEVKYQYLIVRKACDAPTFSLNYANVAANQSTFAPNFTMVLNTTEITASSQVSVQLNNKDIPFNLDLANKTVTVEKDILVGSSSFVVKLTNECGTKTYTHNVSRVKSPTKVQPTVQLTNPSTAASTVSSTSYTLKFNTTQIIDKAEIQVMVNGEYVPVSFNKTSNSGSANIKLNSGTNSIKVSVANPVGSASDAATIIYSKVGGRVIPNPSRGGTIRGRN